MTKAQKIEDDETSLGKDFGTFKEDFDKFKEDQDLLGEKVYIQYVVFDEIFEKQIEIKQEIALKTRFKINTVNSRFKKDVNLQFANSPK